MFAGRAVERPAGHAALAGAGRIVVDTGRGYRKCGGDGWQAGLPSVIRE
jgi:hypothetical protein